MKTSLLSLLIAAPLAAQNIPPLAEAFITDENGSSKVWIEAASERTIRHRDQPRSLNRTDSALSRTNVFFFIPAEYEKAMRTFKSQNYEQARTEFAAAKEKYAFVDDVPGNYSTLSGFYEMECARILGDYDGLESLFAKFQPEPLLHQVHITQTELYSLYPAVKSEDWGRLAILCGNWEEKELPGSLRAQVEYCHGLALEGLGRLEDALIAFNKAFVADYTASEVITKKSALACFRIYSKHPEVELARSLHGTPDENPNSSGALLLTEAAALTDLWDKALGSGEKLPADYRAFAKYKKSS
ncbi:MAG: hypothetical protein Q7Q71_09290 [Verrucomicrobiota bacterium JB023]|nr:hypothetical protein [Verrucomicrobiota bacterium JB023]